MQRVEKLTRQFYDRFRSERAQFLSHIEGIEEDTDRAWYATLLLCRLMFLYFIQQRGFLDGDRDYLARRLAASSDSTEHCNFYCHFLLPLFHQGLSRPERPAALTALLGAIPYLDGDFFTAHPIEQRYSSITIANKAFARLFAFFSTYHWRLEEHDHLRNNEITPEMLGYILEQYINQQHMGAYYTKHDITDYIAVQTIIPALFDAVERRHPTALQPGAAIWRPLIEAPDCYIFASLRSRAPLPGETEQECATRLACYIELRAALAGGRAQTIDACITYNLDLLRFASDVMLTLDDSVLLRTFHESLGQLSILDPTCGSGAFLFAALRVLEALYEACFRRMRDPCHVQAFATELAEVCPQSNLPYFIASFIITHNLYGVDLMAETIEICKLRLFLKLMTYIERAEEIKPLPDITRHLRAGNALVGFATPSQHSTQGTTLSLDRELARQAGISPDNEAAFRDWQISHRPFHWHHEFPSIFERGGFSVILGNPPYVEYTPRQFSYTLRDFETLICANLYPCVVERSRQLLAAGGRQGMILPLAAFATRNMIPLQQGFIRWFPRSWLSFYHFRPSMLFSGSKIASIPTVIYLAKAGGLEQRYSTHLHKWSAEQRSGLFERLVYCEVTAPVDPCNQHYYPKFGQARENVIMRKLMEHEPIGRYLAEQPSQNRMHYRSAGGLYWKVFVNFPWPYRTTSNKECSFLEPYERDVFVALLNSSLFWWYYTTTFDTFNLKDYMLFGFRFTYPQDSALVSELRTHCQRLMEDFRFHARHLMRGQTGSYTVYARKSRAIIDDIDHALACHYGLSSTELDFILGYDRKYRMGELEI